MNNKAKYRKFLEAYPQIPLFFQDWYLDLCVEAGAWNVLIYEENNSVRMCWPYFLKQRYFIRFIAMPHLCKFMGPIFVPGYIPKPAVIKDMYTHLPKHVFLQQNIYYNSSDQLMKAFPDLCTIGQSFMLNLSLGREHLWGQINSNYRNSKIKKARSVVQLDFDMNVDEFYKLNILTFSRQNMSYTVPELLFKTIVNGMIVRDSAKLICVRDSDGNLHAGACLAFDENSVYFHSSGTDPELRSSGAGILLVWEAIQWAMKNHPNKKFDFLGSNIPGIARVWKNFGAERVEYAILKQERSFIFKWFRSFRKIKV